MSADTYMNEMLLVATRRKKDDEEESARIVCVNISAVPQSVTESYWYAKWIDDLRWSNANNGVILRRRPAYWELDSYNATIAWFPVVCGGNTKPRTSHGCRRTFGWPSVLLRIPAVVGVQPPYDHARGELQPLDQPTIWSVTSGEAREAIGAFTFDRHNARLSADLSCTMEGELGDADADARISNSRWSTRNG